MAVMPPPRSRIRRLEKVPEPIFTDVPESSWPVPSSVDEWALPPMPVAPPPSGAPQTASMTAVLAPPTGPPPGVSVFEAAPAGAGPTAAPVIDLRAPGAADASATPGTLLAQNVSAWFGSRQVLDRCNLQMPAGQVTAIIGPSGCGKSVFLRNLNRMHEVIPTAKMGGLITLDGVDIHADTLSPTEVRLRIGMVFQRPNPFPSMSIRENVLAGLKLAGKKTSDPEALVEWALRRGGLWNEVKDRLDSSGSALSGGQQQRLCIARSLAVRPRVLLMDEPCSALDPISTRVIEETILEIGREITIVIVTHNMQQAQRVADQCAFFMIAEQGSPGQVIEAGPTGEIFGAPKDQRTSDYVSGRFG